MSAEKFKALVHFVVSSCDDPQRLGAVRLNKILWFADTIAYRLNGVSITGETYVKRQRGPVPRTVVRTIRELESEGRIHVREREHALYKTRLFVALDEPDPTIFSEQEVGIVRMVMDEICHNHTANSISALSHDQIWDAANEGEEIPLVATLAAQPGEITDEVLSWADIVLHEIEVEQQQAA